MKKRLTQIVLTVIIIAAILFVPLRTNAAEIPLRNLYDTTPITVDNVTINPQFIDNSATSTSAFGIGGTIINTDLSTLIIKTTTTYYAQNNSVITISTNSQIVPGQSKTSYTNMTDTYKMTSGTKVSDIAYYSMNVEILSSGKADITPSRINQYKYKAYLIDAYDIKIKVNENNTFDITETITAHFNINKHGIYRKIPLKNKITRLDGSTSTNRAQITNLSVDNEYTTSVENGNYIVKIGSASRTVIGEQKYSISYSYNIGKDPVKEYDELYYNLIGPEWDTVIGNVTFTIEMPKEFAPNKLGFSSGTIGSTENSNIIYAVDENKITGYYNGILEAEEALTVRLELEEGYFVGAGYTTDSSAIIYLIIIIAFVIIGFLLWFIYGRDNQIIETVEFYPPQGFNSLEIGYMYKGTATSMDVTSLLIYLANKGYIKISETETKALFSTQKGFKITKLKEYDGNNINEKVFLDGLFYRTQPMINIFGQQSETKNSNEVTDIDLYNRFYKTTNRIIKNMNTKENKNQIFEKSSTSKNVIIILMIIATFCIITIPPVIKNGGEILFSLIFPGIGFSVLIASITGSMGGTVYINGKATTSRIVEAIFGLVWGCGFGGIPWAILVLPMLTIDYIYLIIYIVGLICVAILFIIKKHLPKRTPYGNEMLGKINGFRTFLETAEKERLEAMVMQNPQYYYDILPYTYVLGVSDKWIKKFESISLQAPSWYDSPSGFDSIAFGSFIASTMKTAQTSMSSSPSSSGGSSGGGSSGGGSGGGGGGSW